jgi:hypothetical protein
MPKRVFLNDNFKSFFSFVEHFAFQMRFYLISDPQEVSEMGKAWLLFGPYPGPSILPRPSTYKAHRLLSLHFIIPELIMLATLCIVGCRLNSFGRDVRGGLPTLSSVFFCILSHISSQNLDFHS